MPVIPMAFYSSFVLEDEIPSIDEWIDEMIDRYQGRQTLRVRTQAKLCVSVGEIYCHIPVFPHKLLKVLENG